ncbi:MAG: outer membrane lipoprotein-sorting protein [Phaeodactylibacter sp.]|nr:outer membrane lipoprotein-sorting protein [Phaeodactylibacter sp.]MCB9047892.1 outer membrane lipoprotein-sorting protein [Lewinellaceae bacterium]
MKKLILAVLTITLAMGATANAQSLTAKEIIQKADQKQRGETSSGELKMTIVRPTWKREMQMKSWSMGTDYMLILVTAPARDKGAAFLKRENEIWNWQPTIDRTIKLPPSMMMQSWMGSDFTNDDLVRESSIVIDYTHKLLGKETIEGRSCYKIELTPKEDAPVVWGKIISWIDTEEFMQMKAEMYDEDGYLVNTMYGKNVRKMDDRILPSIMEVVPADKEGQKTIVEYLNLKFNEPIKESFFSIQNMKRVR